MDFNYNLCSIYWIQKNSWKKYFYTTFRNHYSFVRHSCLSSTISNKLYTHLNAKKNK